MAERNNDNDSLKKSHSKLSNGKLTLLCLFTILAFSALWVGLAMLPDYQTFGLIITIISGVLLVLGLFGFNSFKR